MSNSVAIRSAAFQSMLSSGVDGRALMGGTKAMRAAGTRYLPKFEAESEGDYKSRLDASWLFNGYGKTARDMTGRVFTKPVEIGEGADARIVEWCQNVDLQGNDLSVFARNVFENAVSAEGIGYIMVDAPLREGEVTQDAARALNLRPYLSHFTVNSVLGIKSESINNVQTLTQIRIMESVNVDGEADEFTQETVKQIRVLDRTETTVQTRIYREGASGWELFGEPTFSGLSEITIVPFYANRTGFFTGAPLLSDLADINIAHWQSQSDQRNILHVARVPILFGAGFDADEDIVVGSNQAVISSNEKASLAWTEHSGKAIDAGRTDLKDLEFQMEAFGLSLLVAQSGGQTATGEALDAAKETSTLAMTADALKDALEQALLWMAEYGGINGPAIEVKVNKEFGAWPITPAELTVLQKDVAMGYLSKEAYYEIRKQRGILRPDLDVADDMAKAQEDAADGLTEDGG